MSFMSYASLNGHGRKVEERCPKCGKRAAYQRGDTVLISHPRCVVPGPADPPIEYRADTVVFVLGDFSAAELRQQRDEAEAELNEMRPEFHRRGRAIESARKALAEPQGAQE